MPLLPADAGAAEGAVRGGLEGNERLITVLFVDLRGSTDLGESKMPYDLLFILNQFFHEMTKALDATNGHYAQFAGDGNTILDAAPFGLAGIPAVALVQRYGENDATFPGNYPFHTASDTPANVSNRRLWLKAAKLTLAAALDLAGPN